MKKEWLVNIIKEHLGLIFVLIIFLAVLPIYINARMKLSEIDKNGKIGIGKFIEYEKLPKTKNYYFEFYSDKKNVTFIKNPPDGFQKKIGSFFEIKYLDKFDDLIIVNYEKEIIDTTAILNAGFSLEDLK